MNQNVSTNSIRVRVIILAVLMVITGAYGQEEAEPTTYSWKIGEELHYRVKWLSFTIGTIIYQVLEQDTLNGHPVYHCRLTIDSNPSLPFVDLHEVYDSYIDEDMFSRAFEVTVKKSDHTDYVLHDIDYTKGVVNIRVRRQTENIKKLVKASSFPVSGPIQDGLSVLYFARSLAEQKDLVKVPVLSFQEVKMAQITFTGKKHRVNVNKQSVAGYFLEGLIKFVGIGGIKDDCRGWFSTDTQRVPLEAEMKASLGSVKIELVKWENWNPEGMENVENGLK